MARPLFLAALVLAVSACGERKGLPTEPDGRPPDSSATFSRVVREVFVPSCALAGCHAPPAPQAGLSLQPGEAYANLVNKPATQRPELVRVAPFDPDSSYLVKKLRGDPDIVGSPMPLSGTLSGEARQLVIDWVRRGAPPD